MTDSAAGLTLPLILDIPEKDRAERDAEREERMWPVFGANFGRMWCRHQYVKPLIVPLYFAFLWFGFFKQRSFMAKASDYLSNLVKSYECVVASDRSLEDIKSCSDLNRSSEVFYIESSLAEVPVIRRFNCSKGAPDLYFNHNAFVELSTFENIYGAFAMKDVLLPLLLTYFLFETFQLLYYDLLSIAPVFPPAALPTLEHLAGFRIGFLPNNERGLHISYYFFCLGVCPTLIGVLYILTSSSSPFLPCTIVSSSEFLFSITALVVGITVTAVPILYIIYRYYFIFVRNYLQKHKSFELVVDHCRSHFYKRRFSEKATFRNRNPFHAIFLVVPVIAAFFLSILFISALLVLAGMSFSVQICWLIFDTCLIPLQLCPFRKKVQGFRMRLQSFVSTRVSFSSDTHFLLIPLPLFKRMLKTCLNIIFDNGYVTRKVESCRLE